MEHYVHAYYDLMDQCEGFPDWQRKIEEELGQAVAMTVIGLDESVRDAVVARSPYF